MLRRCLHLLGCAFLLLVIVGCDFVTGRTVTAPDVSYCLVATDTARADDHTPGPSVAVYVPCNYRRTTDG